VVSTALHVFQPLHRPSDRRRPFARSESRAQPSSQPTHLLGPISDPSDPSDPSDLATPAGRARASGSRALQPNADDRAMVGDFSARPARRGPRSHVELSDARVPTTAQLSAIAQLDRLAAERDRAELSDAWAPTTARLSAFAQLDVTGVHCRRQLPGHRSPPYCRHSLNSTGSPQATRARPR
jgi:hypothetical protein